MKKLVPALAVAVLALVGCSAADSAPEPSAPVETSPVAAESASPEPVETVDPALVSQERADRIMDQFLESYNRDDFDEFSDGTPHQNIQNWSMKDDGKSYLIVIQSHPIDFKSPWLAEDFLKRTHKEGGIESVTVLDENDYGATRSLTDIF